ncbi:MAG: 4-hydroxy-3-methylbut-2-enyl diphosphate reductase [Armatimonadota bacterium]
MEIILAKGIGFCFGVRRAIQLAEAELRKGRKVNLLGPLVHNHQETARLAEAGLLPVEQIDDLSGDTVVIRAHGERPEVFDRLQQRNFQIIDATCPFVTTSQQIARQYTAEGYTLVIVGSPEHPEVQGVLGYITSPGYVVMQPEEVAALPPDIRPIVIAQTTVNEQTFQEVAALIAQRYPTHIVRNTVCSATKKRQEASRLLAEGVDVVYVVGGKHSSNTKRLAEICRQSCPRTYHIETPEEINAGDIKDARRVGITAGASTPDWLIEQAVERLRALAEEDATDSAG